MLFLQPAKFHALRSHEFAYEIFIFHTSNSITVHDLSIRSLSWNLTHFNLLQQKAGFCVWIYIFLWIILQVQKSKLSQLRNVLQYIVFTDFPVFT